jgi:hypothetical protein
MGKLGQFGHFTYLFDVGFLWKKVMLEGAFFKKDCSLHGFHNADHNDP